MKDTTVEVIEEKQVTTLEIDVEVTMLGMPRMIGQSYKRLAEYLDAHGGERVGEPYVRYLGIHWESMLHENRLVAFFKMFTRRWKMKIGFPLKAGIAGEGDIRPGTLPAGSYLKTVHVGPYSKLGDAYNRLYTYAKKSSLELAPECIEEYLNDPAVVGESRLETVVLIPLAS